MESNPDVTAVSNFFLETVSSAAAIPVAGVYAIPQWLWAYQDINAPAAWDASTGGGVKVGIIDEGNVYPAHPDLANVESMYVSAPYEPASHATHVAGLACADANAIGMVGMAWGCPLVSTAIGAHSFATSVLEAAEVMSVRGDVKVVNVSLQVPRNGCISAAQAAKISKQQRRESAMFRQVLSGVGRDVVWTVAAGNQCAPVVASPMAAVSDLENVIVVAATNSGGALATFSNHGSNVNVAAPGGVGEPPLEQEGLMSTWLEICTITSSCECTELYCTGYRQDWGTSMAAPVVAGVAADVWAAHASMSASEVAECIKQTAGSARTGDAEPGSIYPVSRIPLTPYSGGIPIVDAAAAVECKPESEKEKEKEKEEVSVVSPIGPTAGPIGFSIPLTAPECAPLPGEHASIEVFMDHALYEGITPSKHPVEHGWLWFYKGSSGLHGFSFECVSSKPGSDTVRWTAAGFSATITGPGQQLTLANNVVDPGETVATSSGTPGGPSPCPTVAGITWLWLTLLVEERVGSPFSGETFYFPAEATYSLEQLRESSQTTISVTLPSSIREKGRWNLRLICHAGNASPLDTQFEYTGVVLTVEGSTGAQASGGPATRLGAAGQQQHDLWRGRPLLSATWER
ncbi:MAG TPA: S8 family serine peptidase [Solirubrobacteraceae bacterium]|nr:S8 family serine peptidase [Solirubrobacteraceae bacterium]